MSSKSLDFALAFGSREDVASATTTNIGSTSSRYVRITGTTTITGLGTADAGTIREVLFSGSLTLTHNGTSLILPGGENVETSAGDVVEFISEGSGNWRCVRYVLGNIAPVYIERGTAKAWANLNGTGTIALRDSLNVSSVVDNGVGDYTWNVTNAFGAADYTAQVSSGNTAGANNTGSGTRTVATTSFRGEFFVSTTAVKTDRELVFASLLGDLA